MSVTPDIQEIISQGTASLSKHKIESKMTGATAQVAEHLPSKCKAQYFHIHIKKSAGNS
jgi:hypothetical protein